MKNSKNCFIANEDGASTPLAIGLCVIFVAMGGLAVDFNKAMGERTQMQMATDSAAHAALYAWEFDDVPTSRQASINTIGGMLPDAAFRDALRDTDIEFGFWDPDLATFTADQTFVEDEDQPLRKAVRVRARLEEERGNQSRNILLSIVGQDTLEIGTSTVYAHYYPHCLYEGFVADDVVDMQSGSIYLDGFCMHSNTYVSLNQNNYFEAGTVVSMPNLADLDIPESGFEKNEGLQAALRQGAHRLRILAQLENMFESLRDGDHEFAEMAGVTETRTPIYPIDTGGNGANAGPSEEEVLAAQEAYEDYNDSTLLDTFPRYNSNDTGKKTLNPLDFLPRNHIYRLQCTGNGDITLQAGHYKDFVLVTDCEVNFANGVLLDGVLIASEQDVNSSHVQIGLDDDCADGGNASIWTMGSFNTASNLEAYGAQILAWGDITFTAGADGIEGVSFISYGTIDGTSQGQMGYCDRQGISDFAVVPYFRAVQ